MPAKTKKELQTENVKLKEELVDLTINFKELSDKLKTKCKEKYTMSKSFRYQKCGKKMKGALRIIRKSANL